MQIDTVVHVWTENAPLFVSVDYGNCIAFCRFFLFRHVKGGVDAKAIKIGAPLSNIFEGSLLSNVSYVTTRC